MIKVCDSMMGTGKSSACIRYMNEHPDDKFIYLSIYTDEDERIAQACPALRFKQPSDKKRETGYSKSRDTADLLSRGENVASTHQCFKFYTADVLDYIRDQGYTLMVDESMSVLEEYKDVTQCDIDMMCSSGFISYEDDEYALTGKEYTGCWGREFIRLLQSRTLITVKQQQTPSYYYWALPENLLTAFKDVILMTYLFEGTDMHYYLKMHSIPYVNIGVMQDERGYRFDETIAGSPVSFSDLINKVHICDNPKRNAIGEDYYALSLNWFRKDHKDEEESLKKQLYNWFNNDHREYDAGQRLWANIGESHGTLRTTGVWNNNLVFNYRATNKYADRVVLAYPVNVFANVDKKNYYARHGLEFNDDKFALSTMIQWIWRSAIRKGEEIWIYIPSRRMRELLQGWLEDLANGKDPAVRGCPDAREEMHQLLVERGVRIQSAM